MAVAGAAAAQSADIVLLSQTARGFSAEGQSNTPAVNLNGLITAYSSNAKDLVAPALQTPANQVYARLLDLTISDLLTTGPDGKAGNAASQDDGIAPGISDDGRVTAFFSLASNLVPDATNGKAQIYVFDGAIHLVSRGTDGMPANGDSSNPKLSGDGRFVVFQSTATNLVDEDTRGVSQIYVYDRLQQTIRVVSVAADGTVGNRDSITPAISENGNAVAFASSATTLVTQSFPTGVNEIFVHELTSGMTELVSVSSGADGVPGNKISYFPALSRDGSLVVFKSEAFNLVARDTNGEPDVFVRDRANDSTQRVSVDSFGNQSNGLSGGPAISGDGRFVAFPSFATNLVPDDGDGQGDVFVYDRSDDTIKGVTVGKKLQPNDSVSDVPVSISADGRWIGFASAASNLVPNDLNNNTDAFLACNPYDAFDCAPPTATPTVPVPPTPTPTVVYPCVGDCNGDGVVMINELILMVNIALEIEPLCPGSGISGCLAGDANCDCQITVDEIIRAVNNALQGCHDYSSCSIGQEEAMCCGPTPTPGTPTTVSTPTPTEPTATPTGPTPTPTNGAVCVGDCDGNGSVTIDDLIRMVNVALDLEPVCACLAGDSDCNCQITVDEIIQAVNNALNGCTTFNPCDPIEHQAMCCS